MRTTALLTICICFWMTIAPTTANAQWTDSPPTYEVTQAIDKAVKGECPARSAPVNFGRLNSLMQKLRSEELKTPHAKELADLLLALECNLSDTSQEVVSALRDEVRVRELTAQSLLEGNIELVTPELLPRAWNSFESELGHLDDFGLSVDAEEKVAPVIVMGCVTIVISGIAWAANSDACKDDLEQLYLDCKAGNLCPANRSADASCCEARWQDDLENCIKSGGTNTYDDDYGFCCN